MVLEGLERIRAQNDDETVALRAQFAEQLEAARDAIMEEQRIKLEAIMEEQRSIREVIRESTNAVVERLVAVQNSTEEADASIVVAGELVVGLGTAVEEVGVVVNRIRQQQRALPSAITLFCFSCIFCSDELPQLYHPQPCDDACRQRLFLP